MSVFLAAVFFGIVPMVIYALIIWRLDRWEPEPLPLLIAAFAWGAVPSVFFAGISQLILGAPAMPDGVEAPLLSQLYDASFLAPLTEEMLKGAGVVLIFLLFPKEIDSVLDGLVYGSVVGFGFAAVENVFYLAGEENLGGVFVLFFLRAVVFGMMHALFTGLFGIGMALGKFSRVPFMRFLWPIFGLGAGMFMHALHNYFATMGGAHILIDLLTMAAGVVWFFTTFAFCLYHENCWIRIQLAEEVNAGVLYAQQALDAANFWQRGPLSMFTHGIGNAWKRRTLLKQATRLAFQKQRLMKSPDRAELALIDPLRARVYALSRADPLFLSGAVSPHLRFPPPLPPRRTPPALPRA